MAKQSTKPIRQSENEELRESDAEWEYNDLQRLAALRTAAHVILTRVALEEGPLSDAVFKAGDLEDAHTHARTAAVLLDMARDLLVRVRS